MGFNTYKYSLFVFCTNLCDKDPKQLQSDVPCEELEGGTDPQVVEQGEVQQSSYTVKRLGSAEDGDHTQMRKYFTLAHRSKH